MNEAYMCSLRLIYIKRISYTVSPVKVLYNWNN